MSIADDKIIELAHKRFESSQSDDSEERAKRKADIEKANEVFLSMIKIVKDVDTDEEAKLELAKTLYSFERGQMFIAEHIFGKPKKTIENINIDAGKLTDEDAANIILFFLK